MTKFISLEIIRKYLSGNCSQEEIDSVLEWFGSHDLYPEQLAGLSAQEQGQLHEMLFKRIMQNVAESELNNGPEADVFGANDVKKHSAASKPIYKWIYAAATVLIFSAVTLFLFSPHKTQLPVISKQQNKASNSQFRAVTQFNKAVLTLANGKKINLTNAQLGTISQQGQAAIVKTNEGQVAYNSATNGGNAVVYNELAVPKGSKYEIVLADGTKVCLNAASKLRFPSTFNGNKRNVELIGEGYFEVAKNAHKPFNVTLNGLTIQVLGTHFDISAYKDDSFIKTTLLEGSVKVIKNKTTKMLTPGNQAIVSDNTDAITINKVNVENAIAWKSGFFIFEHENITEIMKKVSRWYDVDVSAKEQIKTDQHFSGQFDRSKSVDELINYLEKLDAAHFTIQGRRIQMMN